MPNEFADSTPSPLPQAAHDQNPYASPLAQGPFLAEQDSEPVGIWRHKDRVIIHRSLALPPRCIRTNRHCDETEKRTYKLNSNTVRRIVMVVTSGMALAGLRLLFSGYDNDLRLFPALPLIVIGVSLTAVIYYRGSFEVPYHYYWSHAARRSRLRWRAVGVFTVLIAIGLFVFVALPLIDSRLGDFVIGVGILTLIAGGIVCFLSILPFRVEPAGNQYYVLHGCGEAFRNSFPEVSVGKSLISRLFPDISFSNK